MRTPLLPFALALLALGCDRPSPGVPAPTPLPVLVPAPSTSVPVPASASVPPAPVPIELDPPRLPALNEPFTLARGRVHRLGTGPVRVACAAIEGPCAELEVLFGPLAFPVRVDRGALIPIAQGLLEVAAIDARAQTVDLRWRRPLPADPTRWELVHAPRPQPDGALRVRAMSFARLADGTWLSVGSVADARATVHRYPARAFDDPTCAWDRLFRAAPGARLGSELALEAVEPGAVLLRPLRG